MSSPVQYAPKAYKFLNGVFAVHKPANVTHFALFQSIQTKLALEINSLEQRPQKKIVVFKRPSELRDDPAVDESVKRRFQESNETNLDNSVRPVCVPDWFDHPLVQGPRYAHRDFDIKNGHMLDTSACGVVVVGLQRYGLTITERLWRAKLPRKYLARGHLGLASFTFTGTSKIVERSTWQHVTPEKLNRVLMHVQNSHRKACVKESGVELSSQKAYELASKGLLKPTTYCGPVMLDLKLVKFEPPEFEIEVVCIDEACTDIRRLIHEVGVMLKTNAICTYLHRKQDGPFLFDDPHTLLLGQISIPRVLESMQYFRDMISSGLLRRKRHFRSESVVIPVRETVKQDRKSEQVLLSAGPRDGVETASINLQ